VAATASPAANNLVRNEVPLRERISSTLAAPAGERVPLEEESRSFVRGTV